ncbi:hypothetical protein BDF21DRAFT_404932 [Thamnidium elegans]|nr:hypothetical protein BDF21DRAFT_404932 [Thamnidium elegans]
MAADGPPSNISNIEIDKPKALLNPNKELNSISNNISSKTEYSPQLATSFTGHTLDDLKNSGDYSTDTDSGSREKNSESKHKPPVEDQPSNKIKGKRAVEINFPTEEIKNNISERITFVKNKLGKTEDKSHQTNPEYAVMSLNNTYIQTDDIVLEQPYRESCLPRGSFNGETKEDTEHDYSDMREYKPIVPPKPIGKDKWQTNLPPHPPKKDEPKDFNLPHHEEGGSLPFGDNELNSTDDESKKSNENNPNHLQLSYDERKKNNLIFIRKYEPTFEFKEKDDTVNIRERMKHLNQEFCDKCEQLEKYYIADVEKEDKKNIQIKEEIDQFNLLIKEFNETCSELEEDLKKADSELFTDSDIVFKNYQNLRDQVNNYLNNQGYSTEDRIDSMVQTLLDRVILCHPFEPLKVIEELFNSSGHENWIAHARNQIISLLLTQDRTHVDTQLTIDIFKQNHKISLKSIESLENAVKFAYELSKYAIAPDIYFNGDVSLKGLSLLKKKEVYTKVESKTPITTELTVNLSKEQKSPYILEPEKLKQVHASTIKQQENILPLLNERPALPKHDPQTNHHLATTQPSYSGCKNGRNI